MDFSLRLALRYLLSGRKNLFFSWISILSILGIAIGVATMIVVLSVINGFESELQNRFLSANAHVLIFRYPVGMRYPDRYGQEIHQLLGEKMIASSAFVHYETMAKKGPILHSVLIRGFEPDKRKKVQDFAGSIQPTESLQLLQDEMEVLGDIEKPAVIVGSGVLSIMGLSVGEDIRLISPSKEGAHAFKDFRIVGTYSSGLKHYDNRLMAMSLRSAQEFFNMGSTVTGLEIGLKNPFQSVPIASQIRDHFATESDRSLFSVKEWQSFNKPLLEALKMERTVIFLIVCLVSVVAGFNILTTLFVGVTHKQRDISLLKALGAQNSQIVMIFLKQGMLFGVVGVSLGMLLALVISRVIETYHFIDLPDPYFLKYLPVEYDPAIYLSLSALGVFICIVSAIMPALTASRVVPTVGLRSK
jgi:lipoprotein-releasing system permease protein